MKLYITEAFSSTPFGGNQAGVVLLGENEPFPSEETMIRSAAELRYSETALVKQKSCRDFETRYFTPYSEVELCGHAT
ncbi:MAG: PhzF family phenazine biosynthesis protein, partial [Bacteroidales bacterium]|nr:PhzF family phenazine biosynthesis protein [Bacteroidales bacterium]